MARKTTAPAAAKPAAATPAAPAALARPAAPAAQAAPAAKLPAAAATAKPARADSARADLVARAEDNAAGCCLLRSDPLADAQAARTVVALVRAHAPEFLRRGLPAAYTEVALELAREIEEHLQALPAAAVSARGRSPEHAELIADAAAMAQAVREGVLRVARGVDGRRVAHAFGLGEPFSARLPAHVLRALERVLAGAGAHPEVAKDLGLLSGDLETLRGLAADLRKLPNLGAPLADEHDKLFRAHGALRAFFDLVAAKGSISLSGDPDERARLLNLLPRADDRRRQRRSERASE